MKLVRFLAGTRVGLGVVDGDVILDCDPAAHGLPDNVPGILQGGAPLMERIRRIAANSSARYPIDDVQLLAPIPHPGKFLCVGHNYLDHIEELGIERPAKPTIFNKQSTCVTGSRCGIVKPVVSDHVDYEGELGIVIGRRCRLVPRERASEVIGGFVAVNDVSVRDWQKHSPTWTMGKSFDTHGPIGPWLVTADEIGDPHRLDIRTWVNDELRQSSNTRQLLFDCWFLVAYLSTAFTLEPGDIIATGTPGGVGFKMSPPRWLTVGDTVRVEIEGIGVLENPVVAEPENTAFIE